MKETIKGVDAVLRDELGDIVSESIQKITSENPTIEVSLLGNKRGEAVGEIVISENGVTIKGLRKEDVTFEE